MSSSVQYKTQVNYTWPIFIWYQLGDHEWHYSQYSYIKQQHLMLFTFGDLTNKNKRIKKNKDILDNL